MFSIVPVNDQLKLLLHLQNHTVFHIQIANHVQEMLIARKSKYFHIYLFIFLFFQNKPEMVMYDKHQ